MMKLDPTIIDLFYLRPLAISLEDEVTMGEVTDEIRGMSNWKAIGPGGLWNEILMLGHPKSILCCHNILVIVWRT